MKTTTTSRITAPLTSLLQSSASSKTSVRTAALAYPLPPVPSLSASQVVVRRDLRDLSQEEQERFANAVEKMMEPGWSAKPENGVTSKYPSEFFRLASYHGWPGEYCTHGRETFPAWHRAYLTDFEQTLQAADLALRGAANGGGRIALPYWGWERGAVKGEVLPAVIRRRFGALRPDLIPKGNEDVDIVHGGYQLVSDSAITRGMTRANLLDQVRVALQQRQHYLAASTAARNTRSVETPHNTMHVLCGFPMTSVDFAAFHPIFFLHHCNVDRHYEAYLKEDVAMSGGTNSGVPWHEFEVSSSSLWSASLEPFKHPATGKAFLPVHAFKTEALGYRYDTLPPIPPARMTAPPTLTLFDDVNPNALKGRSLALHIFVMKAGEAEAFATPDDVEAYDDDPRYAGLTGVFGAKAGACENCATRDPLDITVDVTEALKRLGLSRHEAGVRVVAIDMNTQAVVPYEDIALPAPRLVGPFFEDTSAMLARVDAPDGISQAEAGEVTQLQRYLAKYGFYQGEPDGFYGPVTDAAVHAFQQRYGLTDDGIAGPETRGFMLRTRIDDKPDHGVDANDTPTFKSGAVIRWWVGGVPGYLAVDVVREEVEEALAEWASAAPLVFMEVDSREAADLVVTWDDHSQDNLFKFDGPGGALAFTEGAIITLDKSEYWLAQDTQNAPEGAFFLLPVVLHEIGHALGLIHSSAEDDVMSPFYVPDRVVLSDNDRRRIVEIYPLEDRMAEVFNALDADRDGRLGRQEFVTAMTTSGDQPMSEDDANALFDSAIASASRRGQCPGSASSQQPQQESLDLREFVQLMARLYFQ